MVREEGAFKRGGIYLFVWIAYPLASLLPPVKDLCV